MSVNRRNFLAGTALAGGLANSSLGVAVGRAGSVWQIGPPGEFRTMRRVDVEVAEPGPGEALIQVHYSAVAGRDRAIAAGWFLEDKPADRVPLSEGVGRVVAVGPGVDRINVGERVISAHFARWASGPWSQKNYSFDVGNTVDGWLGEFVSLPESGLAVVPDDVDDRTAATLSGSGVTAWNALFETARLEAGNLVLTLGTGGVSSWGLLLAKAAGARVAVTSSSDDKLARFRELGADYAVNYRTRPDWDHAVLEETGGRGADIVLENVGRPTLDQSMHAAAENAFIVMIGTGPIPDKLPAMRGWYVKNIALKAISNGSRVMLEKLLNAVAASRLQAEIAHEVEFQDAPRALELLAEGDHTGKIIIRHPAASDARGAPGS